MKLAAALPLLALLTAAAPTAHAEPPPVHLLPGFDHLEVPLPAATLDLYPERLGIPRTSDMMSCSNDNLVTTQAPLLTFTVDTPTRAVLSIQGAPPGLDLRGIAVFIPNNRLYCIRESVRYRSDLWEPGRYEIRLVAYGKLTYDALLPVDLPDGGVRVVFEDLTPRALPLDPTVGPTPQTVAALRHDRRSEGVDTFGVRCPEANVTTVAPAAEITLPAPVAKLRVAIAGGTEAVIVTDANGRSACSKRVWLARDYRYVDLDNVPAGPLAIRAAGLVRAGSSLEQSQRHLWVSEPFDRPTFDVLIEDLSRPRTEPWADGEAPPTLALTGPLATAWQRIVPVSDARTTALPSVSARRLANGPGQQSREFGTCGGFVRSDIPAVLLDARRPIKDLWYRAVSNRPVQLVLAGPFGEDGRPGEGYEEHCLAAGRQPLAPLGDLDLGRWRVYVGEPQNAAPDDVVLILGTKGTPLAPLALYRTPPDTLAVADKAVLPYFAALPVDHNAYLDWDLLTPFDRQDLVAQAPLSLFAYPKFDLDAASAQVWGVDEQALAAAGSPLIYPLADEPLLVLDVNDHGGATVMTTDANLLAIDVKYLAAAPQGPAKVPTTVRNLILKWNDVVRWAFPEDAKEIARVEKARDKADACYADYWDQHHGGVSGRLSLVTYVNGRVSSVRDYTQMVDDRATAKCGLRNVDKLQGAMLAKLDKRFRKRGAEHLGAIAKRFAAP